MGALRGFLGGGTFHRAPGLRNPGFGWRNILEASETSMFRTVVPLPLHAHGIHAVRIPASAPLKRGLQSFFPKARTQPFRL